MARCLGDGGMTVTSRAWPLPPPYSSSAGELPPKSDQSVGSPIDCGKKREEEGLGEQGVGSLLRSTVSAPDVQHKEGGSVNGVELVVVPSPPEASWGISPNVKNPAVITLAGLLGEPVDFADCAIVDIGPF